MMIKVKANLYETTLSLSVVDESSAELSGQGWCLAAGLVASTLHVLNVDTRFQQPVNECIEGMCCVGHRGASG